MKYFVISDTHFFHKNIIKYCNRPFYNEDEMNEKLINNWNEVVGKNDIVFHLGDFIFGFNVDFNKLSYIRSRLNGLITLIKGNHDFFLIKEYKDAGFDKVYNGLYEEDIFDIKWVFSHYQMTSWNESHKGSFHLFGHEHWKQQLIPSHKIYKDHSWSERKFNVCVDANNFTPIDLFYLKGILEKRPINEFQRIK